MQSGQVVDLYGIAVNPARPDLFAVGGDEEFVHVYDARRLCHRDPNSGCPHNSLCVDAVTQFCPARLEGPSRRYARVHVTSVAFSRRGELLATYNDDDIYIFRPSALLRGLADGDFLASTASDSNAEGEQVREQASTAVSRAVNAVGSQLSVDFVRIVFERCRASSSFSSCLSARAWYGG
jgi:hypothetical protein